MSVPAWVWGGTAAIVSGALMATCYWPLNLHALAWIGLVPWLVVLPRLKASTAGLLGLVLALVFYRIGLAWLFQVHSLLAGVSIFVLSAWMGLSFSLARTLMGRHTWNMLWAVPFALVGQEILRCEGLPRMRFAFAAFGYSQSHNIWIAQTASVGGVYFVAFLVVLVNAAIACAVIHRRARACLPLALIATVVVVLGFASQPPDYSRNPRIPAACVQAESSSMRVYGDLTRAVLEDASHPKLVVLPEHTIADYAHETHPLVRLLGRLAREHAALICVGAHVEPAAGAKCEYDNVAMLIGDRGEVLGRQAKWVPLPFFSDGNPGLSQAVTPAAHGAIGTYVCYDGLFTDIPRRIVALGAEILLVPNMDAARWPAQERWQHADMAPFRSIELRRCAVRANSAGITQIIDASGRVVAQRTAEQGPGTIFAPVYAVTDRTPFVRGGYRVAQWLGIAYLAALILTVIREWWIAVRTRWIACRTRYGSVSVSTLALPLSTADNS